ncbi:MAG: L,D-transpeptidase family protein [Pyrinomonadaceae bacterium]|nr:L,D-transpeptidase family protein [Pyrinomonadaceae bacterium]MBP6212737.1 L,D-transpeptidase family protein [Pyrinomonadaceae bacterium]
MKLIVPFGLLLILIAGVSAQVKTPIPAAVRVPFERSLQTIVVTTNDWNATQGVARLFERKNAGSKWVANGDAFPIVVGRSGLAWDELQASGQKDAKIKKEGDGNAPAGRFPLTASFGSGSKPNALDLPYTKLEEYTECVDDVKSSFYNRIVNRMQVGNFDWKSSEKMLAIGKEYDLGIFVAYNSYPVERGRGSCIFLHIWKDAASATSGCTAMERRDLERILGWVTAAKNPYLVQLPKDVYEKNRKSWNLPKLK